MPQQKGNSRKPAESLPKPVRKCVKQYPLVAEKYVFFTVGEPSEEQTTSFPDKRDQPDSRLESTPGAIALDNPIYTTEESSGEEKPFFQSGAVIKEAVPAQDSSLAVPYYRAL